MSTPTTPATPATPAASSESSESVVKKVGSFFEHIYDFLKSHLGEAASFEHTAATALAVIQPLLNSLLTLTEGSAIAAKVAGVVTQVTTDLNNTSAMLNGAEAGDASHSIAGFLTSIQNNLSTLLADADIKNSAKAADIENVVNLVIGEVKAVIAAIPADQSTPVVGASTAA